MSIYKRMGLLALSLAFGAVAVVLWTAILVGEPITPLDGALGTVALLLSAWCHNEAC